MRATAPPPPPPAAATTTIRGRHDHILVLSPGMRLPPATHHRRPRTGDGRRLVGKSAPCGGGTSRQQHRPPHALCRPSRDAVPSPSSSASSTTPSETRHTPTPQARPWPVWGVRGPQLRQARSQMGQGVAANHQHRRPRLHGATRGVCQVRVGDRRHALRPRLLPSLPRPHTNSAGRRGTDGLPAPLIGGGAFISLFFLVAL
jgi:hypothetical protein